MTKEERRNYNKQATQLLGWVFGWWKDKKSNYRIPIGFEIHHIDGDVTNNSLDNLQVLTVDEHRKIHEETRRERCKINGKIYGKINGGHNRKRVLCIETGIIYESTSEASRQTRAKEPNISKVCNGKRKTTGGYHWRYV